MNEMIQHELENMEAYSLLALKQQAAQPFHVPKDYFATKKDSLFEITQKAHAFHIPDGYFENLSARVMSQIDEIESAQHTIKPKKRIALTPYISIAASILLLVATVFIIMKPSQENETASYSLLEDSDSFDALEIAYITDNTESFVLNAIYEDLSIDTADETELLDPLFDDLLYEEDEFDNLFLIVEELI